MVPIVSPTSRHLCPDGKQFQKAGYSLVILSISKAPDQVRNPLTANTSRPIVHSEVIGAITAFLAEIDPRATMSSRTRVLTVIILKDTILTVLRLHLEPNGLLAPQITLPKELQKLSRQPSLLKI
jgi:hypothetical protein